MLYVGTFLWISFPSKNIFSHEQCKIIHLIVLTLPWSLPYLGSMVADYSAWKKGNTVIKRLHNEMVGKFEISFTSHLATHHGWLSLNLLELCIPISHQNAHQNSIEHPWQSWIQILKTSQHFAVCCGVTSSLATTLTPAENATSCAVLYFQS